MALKVSTTTVVDNARELQNITSIDGGTTTVIHDDIRALNKVLVIRDSTGNEVFRIHGLPA